MAFFSFAPSFLRLSPFRLFAEYTKRDESLSLLLWSQSSPSALVVCWWCEG